MSETGSSTGVETIGLASLNLLLDKTKSNLDKSHKRYVEPQHERIDSLARTLGALPISLDVVMLQELHIEWFNNNAKRLTKNLDVGKIHYFNHNSKRRRGEYIAVCGKKVEHAYSIRIGDDRKALIAVVGDTAFAGVHNRSGVKNGHVRVDQTRRILNELRHYKRAGFIGDTNARPGSRARNLLVDEGYSSVYTMKQPADQKPDFPNTFPTDNYRTITLPSWVPLEHLENTALLPHAMSIDTIEVRGFEPQEVLQAGTVMTKKSDHKTLFAELQLGN